jgi:hypothetical protein
LGKGRVEKGGLKREEKIKKASCEEKRMLRREGKRVSYIAALRGKRQLMSCVKGNGLKKGR